MTRSKHRRDCRLCVTGSHAALAQLYYWTHLHTNATHRIRTGNIATYLCSPRELTEIAAQAGELGLEAEVLDAPQPPAPVTLYPGNTYAEQLRTCCPPGTTFTSQEAAAALQRTRQWTVIILRGLIQEGLVRKHGGGARTRYSLVEESCGCCTPC